MESADNYVTEMKILASEATGVDAETTILTTETTGVAIDAQVTNEVDQVMDIDVDIVYTASVNSYPDTEPKGAEELEGTDELESLEWASELDTTVTQQLNNSSDDMDIRYVTRSG